MQFHEYLIFDLYDLHSAFIEYNSPVYLLRGHSVNFNYIIKYASRRMKTGLNGLKTETNENYESVLLDML